MLALTMNNPEVKPLQFLDSFPDWMNSKTPFKQVELCWNIGWTVMATPGNETECNPSINTELGKELKEL